MRQFIGDSEAVLDFADAALAQAREKGFVLVLAQAPIIQGWAFATNGRAAEGLPLMREGFDAWTKTGAGLANTYY